MSSKVRAIYFSGRHGRFFSGAAVKIRLEDDCYNYGVSTNAVPRSYKSWERMKWMFEHLPPKAAGKLYIFREPHRVKQSRSPYQQYLATLSISEKKWTMVRSLREEQRTRDRLRAAAQRPLPLGSIGRFQVRPRNTVPMPQQQPATSLNELSPTDLSAQVLGRFSDSRTWANTFVNPLTNTVEVNETVTGRRQQQLQDQLNSQQLQDLLEREGRF